MEINTYLKIVPAKISNSSKLKIFFDELLNRNKRDIIECLNENWPLNNEDKNIVYVSEDEKYLDEKEEEDIRRNITG